MPKPKAIEIGDKDVPLPDDIRLLGRILGDTVREQEGEEVFELVEQIRHASRPAIAVNALQDLRHTFERSQAEHLLP